jgi:hypothetical protein
MKGLNNAADLFDPLFVMESDTVSSSSPDANDFGFAFNDSNFSDRILQIEVMNDPIEASSNADGCSTVADWANDRKRRREDINKDNGIKIISFFKTHKFIMYLDSWCLSNYSRCFLLV